MRWRGVLSILVLVLAWAALDDITTDNATGGFLPEYAILVACGGWFTGVSIWLLGRKPLLGITSLGAVVLAAMAFSSLPHLYAPASPVNYLGLLALAWFLALAIWMVARREVAPREHAVARP